MIKKIFALGVVMTFGACAEKSIDELTYTEQKELAQKLVQNCIDQGVPDNSAEMDLCFDIEVVREVKRRQQSAQRLEEMGMAISAGAESYQRSSQASYRQSLNCSSYRLGNSVQTNCY